MTYFNVIVGLGCGLAITVLLVILTDKSFWKAMGVSLGSQGLYNPSKDFSPVALNDKKVKAENKGKTNSPALTKQMIDFQQRHRFYKDGKFQMP